jgi:serine/threonine protein kinase
MYLPPNSNPQLKNTLVQGTFSSKQKYSGLPAAIPRPLVNEAIEEAVEEEEGPRPHPVAPPEVQRSIRRSSAPVEFPAASVLSPRTILFSRIQNMFVGCPMPLDCLEQKSERLGKGGNGTVFIHPLLNEEYAVKLTRYRPDELNEWHRFDHPNVMELLMVCTYTCRTVSRCCQFMPLMTENLNQMVRETCYNGVCSLYSSRGEWEGVVMPNVRHILGGVLEGTAYLHDDMCIQHVDLKASNILIKKSCDCDSIFTCLCHKSAKCLVKLADFDSVKQFQRKEFVRHLEWMPYVPMTPEECGKVMGTPGYRAPEQFMKLAPVVSPNHFLFNKSLEGPWTDIWSMGHVCLTIFLGPNKQQDRQKAWTVHGLPYVKDFSRTHTPPELTHALLRSRQLSLCQPREVFSAASSFTASCIEPEFQKRPTAQQLSNHELLKM